MKLPFPLQPGEQVVLVTRRHWLFFVPRFIGYALLAVLPVAALFILVGATVALKGTTLTVMLIVSAVWLIFWLFRILLLKYRYDHDLWVVTNLRMVDLVAKNPLSFTMSSADLVQLEDTSVSRSGIVQSLFDYGNLECETAGRAEHFTFRDVPNPKQIAAVVEREALASRGRHDLQPPSLDNAPTQRL